MPVDADDTLGVVIAGGAGTRVGGEDKGLLVLAGRPLVAHVLDRLRLQCGRVLIVANRELDDYAAYAAVVHDETDGHAGPLAGLVAAFGFLTANRHALPRWLLTVPVDCPDPSRDFAARLRAALEADATACCAFVRHAGAAQPLFALYRVDDDPAEWRDSARDALRQHGSTRRWHAALAALAVDCDGTESSFHNLNTPAEFDEYARMPQADYPTRIGLEQALQIVATRAVQYRLPIERVSLSDLHGRVLAEDARAPHSLPPFANSAMDGFALRGADLPDEGERAFELVGNVFAGATSAPEVAAGQCVRITTGAPIPPGADTVVIKEHVAIEVNRVTVKAGEKAGSHVRAAGEDYAAGDLAVAAGTPLGAAQLAVLAALGIAQVAVRRRPRIAVIATGNELVPAGQPLGFGQIHESNAVMLAALARESNADATSVRCVRDEPDALREALLGAAADADIVVSSGGVSAGEADHLPDVLQAIGEIHFHKVRLKPGMPTLFGQLGASLYFGLPGNPVAAAVTFRLFVGFALRAMQGIDTVPETMHARLAAPLHKRHARAELARCSLRTDADGVLWADVHAKQGSGMLRGLAETDALALLPEDAHEFATGDVVTLWP